MRIDYGLAGHTRKPFVKALVRVVGEKSIYEGAPKYGFHIGRWYVDRDGGLIVPSNETKDEKDRVFYGLQEAGFVPVQPKGVEEPDELCIIMHTDGFTEQAYNNLRRLIDSKRSLIQKMLGSDSLDFEIVDNQIRFPWFSFPKDPEVVDAYAMFISLLCRAAKTQKRVTAKETPVENEKYAMRCFLLRLGMIGDTYKSARKILLENLKGNSAFKNPEVKGDEG